jgi:hypothetical protein
MVNMPFRPAGNRRRFAEKEGAPWQRMNIGAKHATANSPQRRISEHGKSKPACPKCKGRNVKQQISTFQTKTSRKS